MIEASGGAVAVLSRRDEADARHTDAVVLGRRPSVIAPSASSPLPAEKPSMRAGIAWGIIVGVAQAATPLAFWWLDAATGYAVGLAAIAFVYVGFAVADGRVRVIVTECAVAMAFVLVATAGITGSAWLLVFGFAAHGVKDAWQERRQFVSGTRWWPPFCAAVDWVVALIIGIEIVAGVHFHS
ncbi:MAG: hypothetical protein ACJ79W_20635 [Myxococcales bacterium]